MGAKTLLTVEQFEQLPEIDGISYELDQGELVEVPSASLEHNLIRDELRSRLWDYLKNNKDRGIAVAEQRFRLGPEIIRQPDVALVGPDQRALILPDTVLQPFGPRLAAEIVSPSNKLTDLIRKTQQYLEGGARTVWILVPPSREVYVYGAGVNSKILSPADQLEEPALLPGFSVRVGDVFAV